MRNKYTIMEELKMIDVGKRRVRTKIRDNVIPVIWSKLLTKHDIEPIPFHVVDSATEWYALYTNEFVPTDKRAVTTYDLIDAEMMTVGLPIVNSATNCIKCISVSAVMSVVSLMEVCSSYEFDIVKITEHLILSMSHEIGHIMDFKSFIGKPITVWNKYCDVSDAEVNALPTLRKNASCKTVFEWHLKYHHTTWEHNADMNVGLTDEEYAIDFAKANPGLSRKKLGIDKYVTEERFQELMNITSPPHYI